MIVAKGLCSILLGAAGILSMAEMVMGLLL